LDSIFPYYDFDGTAGFQYTLGADPTCPPFTGTPTTDCFFVNDVIKLSSLTWSAMTVTNYSCPSGYDSRCQVYAFSTNGQMIGASSTVMLLTYYVATHAVIVTTSQGASVSVTPDKGKLDITINYPFANRVMTNPTISAMSPGVSLLVLGAGRAGTGGVSFTAQAGSNSSTVTFAAASGHATVFRWDQNAQVNSASAAVQVSMWNMAQILAFNCSAPGVNCTVAGFFLITEFKIAVALAAFGGWDSRVVVFSWPTVGATGSVYWDPSMESTTTTTATTPNPPGSSAGFISTFSLIALIVAMLFHRS